MKKILVPTDFSVNANNAFFYAVALASEINASITLLHVVEMEMEVLDLPIPSGSAYRATKEAAELAMKAQLELAQGALVDHRHILENTRTMILVGNPVLKIKSQADELAVDLIIMGARGRHKSNLEKILGTRSTAIAGGTKQPVLIIPEDAVFKPIVQLAYASELLNSDPYELWRALDLIKPFSPVVRYLHISQDSSEVELVNENKIRQYVESHNPALQLIFYHVYAKDIDKELEEFSHTLEVDMIVIFHKSRNIFQRMFTRSHTKQLLSMTDIPVLVLSD